MSTDREDEEKQKIENTLCLYVPLSALSSLFCFIEQCCTIRIKNERQSKIGVEKKYELWKIKMCVTYD